MERKKNAVRHTGVSLSVISEETYKKLGDMRDLQDPAAEPRTYTGEATQLIGRLPVKVSYGNQEADLWV